VKQTERSRRSDASTPEQSSVRRFGDRFAQTLPVFALAAVAALALRRLDDFDTWWHLAAGRWIAAHRSIPDTDTLSFTVPSNEWINLQWLYDLVLYFLHRAGGADALVVASTLCFVAAFALLTLNLRQVLGPVATALLVLWVTISVNERFLIRPEMATFPLLAAVQLLLARGRQDPGRLWLLAPLMLLWANLHSLFILGAGAIVCAIAGAFAARLPLLPAGWRRDSAWPDEARTRLLRWGGVAILATLANPYIGRAWLFPFELMSRIDGSSGVYQAIGEFRPPFSGYFPTFAIGSYQLFVFFLAAVAVLAGLARFGQRRRRDEGQDGAGFDVGMLAFATALAWLSLMARRNIGVFALGAAPFAAACVAILAAQVPGAWRQRVVAARGAMAALVAAACIGVTALVVTNEWYARTGETHEFGLGAFESNFPEHAAGFIRERELPGPAYNDLTGGGYLAWANPTGDGVYIDGRLEVYDTEFFSAYMGALGNVGAWRQDADARGIRSAVIFHRWGNRHGLIAALARLPDWSLVYYDEVAVVFVRLGDRGASAASIEAAKRSFATEWHPRTLERLSSPPQTRGFQWSIDRYTALLAYGRVLDTLGDPQGALEQFERALEVGLPLEFEIETRQMAARFHASFGRLAEARDHLQKASLRDPENATVRSMLDQVDAALR
jgi:hypothetical protein